MWESEMKKIQREVGREDRDRDREIQVAWGLLGQIQLEREKNRLQYAAFLKLSL